MIVKLSRDESPLWVRQLRAIASNQLSLHMAGEHQDVKVDAVWRVGHAGFECLLWGQKKPRTQPQAANDEVPLNLKPSRCVQRSVPRWRLP